MIYCNYNTLAITMAEGEKYKVGDTYLCGKRVRNWRKLRFHGLEIKGIDYTWGVRLHFDWIDWSLNKKGYDMAKDERIKRANSINETDPHTWV